MVPRARHQRPVNVLYVENDSGTVGGSTRCLYHLIRALDRDLYRPFVTFARGSESPIIADFERLSCRVIRFGELVDRGARPEKGHGPMTRMSQQVVPYSLRAAFYRLRKALITDLGRARELSSIIRSHRIDLVHANDRVGSNGYAVWAAVMCGVPVIVSERLIYRLGFIDKVTSVLADQVVCMSDSVFTRFLPQAWTRNVNIVYDGVDIPVPRHHPRDGRRLPRPLRVAVVGRLEEWKGQDVFVRAAAILHSSYPEVTFAIVGNPSSGDGARFAERLRELVHELGLDDTIRFTGHIEEIETYIAEEVDILVHTSITPEPFGRVITEGMALAKPVIASDAGGGREIIDNGVTGLLAEPGNPESLAAAIGSLVQDADLAARLADNGRRWVEEQFSMRSTASGMAAVYHDVLRRRGL
ncbi:MAG: glycosyltransferase family 4 protein [Acidobacteriota bacterium]